MSRQLDSLQGKCANVCFRSPNSWTCMRSVVSPQTLPRRAVRRGLCCLRHVEHDYSYETDCQNEDDRIGLRDKVALDVGLDLGQLVSDHVELQIVRFVQAADELTNDVRSNGSKQEGQTTKDCNSRVNPQAHWFSLWLCCRCASRCLLCKQGRQNPHDFGHGAANGWRDERCCPNRHEDKVGYAQPF